MVRRSVGLVAAALFAGCGAPEPGVSLGTAEQGIAGGVLDRDHREVFEVITHWGEGRVSTCTGTLIAPTLVLTARHCVAPTPGGLVVCGEAPFGTPVSGDSVVVTNAPTPTQGSQFFRGARVSVPSEGSDTCGFDIALITLADRVPDAVALPAIPRLDREAQAGEPYVALGYGQDDRGNPTEGRMRLEGLQVLCLAGACRGLGVAAGEFLGEEGVCSGDSGGPALDFEGKVLGALSRGSEPCGTPVYASTAAFPDWLRDTALEAAALGGYEAPLWARTGSSERPPAAEGESCWPAGTCEAGSACYYERDATEAVCTRTCASQDVCDRGARCIAGFDVPEGGLCIAPATSADDAPSEPPSQGGCAVGSSRVPASPSLLFLGALGLLTVVRRRRKPRAE